MENGKDTGVDPFAASFPELLDIGIMGHCAHGQSGLCIKAGIECYQDGPRQSKPNMSIQYFENIVSQCKQQTYQFALGGCGDPDQHEHFQEILEICAHAGIVPNYTTSGFGLTEELTWLCKKYCGAVAVSWYRSRYTQRAVESLVKAGVKTNIHYVLSRSTVHEAVERLEGHSFPEGINAIVFLTVPALINTKSSMDWRSLDTCEEARWSAYISSDMKMMLCSFDNQEMRWAVDLRKPGIVRNLKSSEMISGQPARGVKSSMYVWADVRLDQKL